GTCWATATITTSLEPPAPLVNIFSITAPQIQGTCWDRKCGYCAEKTNKHTKTTCPLNPKYIAKLARTEAAAEQERRTATSATEQEERNNDTTHIANKEQSNTAS
ncbi:hypothetical protein Tco_1425500, partial [Tanacetum coccineum]